MTLPAGIPASAYWPELFVVVALSAAVTAMPGKMPFDVPSLTVPLTVNVVGVGRLTLIWPIPLTF